jgi:predicted acylesterase/phospholipase RssA
MKLEQTCVRVSDGWRWRLSIGPEEGRERVRRVIYRLHPGLAVPVRASKSSDTAFAISVTAWGGFEVVARVIFKDGTEERLTEPLRAEGGESPPSIEEPRTADASGYMQLGDRFKNENAFRLARESYQRALEAGPGDPATIERLENELAVCTYKDPSDPPVERLRKAEQIINARGALAKTRSSRRLGIAGAIYKRLWEEEGQTAHLERALQFYRRGHEVALARIRQGEPDSDEGYTGINAAFILDLLANEEESEAEEAGAPTPIAEQRRAEATRLRLEIIERLRKLEPLKLWWQFATAAEAHLGVGGDLHLARARQLLDAGMKLEVPLWEQESAAMQLAALARCTGTVRREAARSVIEEVFGEGAASRAALGKVGLALSGGGFRASFFHIGVLARLAELDLLRHVEVLSCVSGGSIVGAHYYLLLRKLFEEKPDQHITHVDYLELVQALAIQFVTGVQKNIRMRVLGNVLANARMFIQGRSHSRTGRLAVLYEHHLFSQVDDQENDRPRYLGDLFISPPKIDLQTDDSFSPKLCNWRRKAKVPVLVLNAATLNTGHCWQFTASFMGEPPYSIDPDLDGNERLRRVYYADAPEAHQRVRLGAAVAASSCVPGLFDPLPLDGLYPDRVVRLVDGGTRDNQGVESLLEQRCQVIVVSDASGQMDSSLDPSRGILPVLFRSKELLETQARSGQFRELATLQRGRAIRGSTVVHLKQGLDPPDVAWIGFKPDGPGEKEQPVRERVIPRTIQVRLAKVRTDLDCFSDVEAYALMLAGYESIKERLETTPLLLPAPVERKVAWAFDALRPSLADAPGADPSLEELDHHLGVAHENTFRTIQLSRPLLGATVAFAGAAIVGLGLFAYHSPTGWHAPLFQAPSLQGTVVAGGAAACFALISMLLGRTSVRILRFNRTIRNVLLALGASVVLAALTSGTRLLVDPIFLRLGGLRARKRAATPGSLEPTPESVPAHDLGVEHGGEAGPGQVGGQEPGSPKIGAGGGVQVTADGRQEEGHVHQGGAGPAHPEEERRPGGVETELGPPQA